MTTYNYLGYGVTDENGVAHLDHDAEGNVLSHSYTGTGAGEIDVVASLDDEDHISSSSLSGTYDVTDCLFYDSGITGTSANWTFANAITQIQGSEYTTIKSTNSNSSNGKYYWNNIVTGDFEICVEFKSDYNGICGVGVWQGSSTYSVAWIPLCDWSIVKFKRVNDVFSCQIKTNGSSTWTDITVNSSTSENARPCLYLYNTSGTEKEIQYKNFEVYPI